MLIVNLGGNPERAGWRLGIEDREGKEANKGCVFLQVTSGKLESNPVALQEPV